MVGPNIVHRREAIGRGECDDLVIVLVDVLHFRIEAVDAVAHHTDATNQHTILVQRKAGRIGGKAERRAFRADEAVRADIAVVTRGEVRTGKLAELHAEQRTAFQTGRSRGRREMLLDDHAGGAGRKGIAAGGQIGAGDRFGDRAGHRALHIDAL